jgi:hypothetical protein
MYVLGKYCLMITTMMIISAQHSYAQSQPLGQSGDWGIYIGAQNKELTCYVAAKPQTRAPADAQRNPAYFFISTRPAENVRQEISIHVGILVKAGNAWLITEHSTYELAAKESYLWVKNASENQSAIQAMTASRSITVRAISTSGKLFSDTYSANGLGTALNRSEKECRGIKPSAPSETTKAKPSVPSSTTSNDPPKNTSQSSRPNDACKRFPDLC